MNRVIVNGRARNREKRSFVSVGFHEMLACRMKKGNRVRLDPYWSAESRVIHR